MLRCCPAFLRVCACLLPRRFHWQSKTNPLLQIPARDLALRCRWRSYFTSGSSALYLLSYSLFYFWTRLDITRTVPMVMYFCYMTMVSVSFFCLTGTIGFYGAGPLCSVLQTPCSGFAKTRHASCKHANLLPCERWNLGISPAAG